jgi:hypothetical protein
MIAKNETIKMELSLKTNSEESCPITSDHCKKQSSEETQPLAKLPPHNRDASNHSSSRRIQKKRKDTQLAQKKSRFPINIISDTNSNESTYLLFVKHLQIHQCLDFRESKLTLPNFGCWTSIVTKHSNTSRMHKTKR